MNPTKRTYLVVPGPKVLWLTEVEEGGFVVTSPLDPHLVTQAETIAEAFENAADASRALRQARRDSGAGRARPHGGMTLMRSVAVSPSRDRAPRC